MKTAVDSELKKMDITQTVELQNELFWCSDYFT